MEQRCSDAVLCNPCTAGHFDSTRKKTMLIFADYTFRGWPLIREKRESLVPRKFRSIRYSTGRERGEYSTESGRVGSIALDRERGEYSTGRGERGV